MKIFVDTNVFLRFYLEDTGKQFELTKKLISDIEDGVYQAYTSGIVFLEISYVLKSVYKLPRESILDILKSIQNLKGLKIIDKTNSKFAIRLFTEYTVKFSDCLIASQLPYNVTLMTFDKGFDKIPGIKINHP